MMIRNPASEAMEIVLIDAGSSGESAMARAAKRERSIRRAARRRKTDARMGAADGGGAASTSKTTGSSSISSNRITPSRRVGSRGSGVGERDDRPLISDTRHPTPDYHHYPTTDPATTYSAGVGSS